MKSKIADYIVIFYECLCNNFRKNLPEQVKSLKKYIGVVKAHLVNVVEPAKTACQSVGGAKLALCEAEEERCNAILLKKEKALKSAQKWINKGVRKSMLAPAPVNQDNRDTSIEEIFNPDQEWTVANIFQNCKESWQSGWLRQTVKRQIVQQILLRWLTAENVLKIF